MSASSSAPAACAFCAVAAGAPHHPVWRDDHVLAFLDRAPLAPGHTLVVPILHHETFDDLPGELIAPLFSVAQRLSRAFRSDLGADGSLVAMNTRVSQSVAHVHVHVVPRRKGDGLFSPRRDDLAGAMIWRRRGYAEGDADEIAAKLRAALSRV